MCVYGGSVCVSFCSQGGVCVPPFFALTCTLTPLLRQDQRRRGSFKRWRPLWQKKIAQDALRICVCLRNVKMSFSQHQRPAHHREVERGVFSFQVENRERQKRIAFCVCVTRPCFISLSSLTKLIPLNTRETREKMGVIRCVNK